MNDALVTDNIGLVHRYARPFLHRHDYDDIISAGIVGLVKAAIAYKPDACAFSTQATKHIKTAVLRYINRLSPVVRGPSRAMASDSAPVLSLDMPLVDSRHRDSEWALIDTLAAPKDNIADLSRDSLSAVRQLIEDAADITPCQRAALRKIVAGDKLSHIEQTHLFHFRRGQSRTASKIKELLHDHITA